MNKYYVSNILHNEYSNLINEQYLVWWTFELMQ